MKLSKHLTLTNVLVGLSLFLLTLLQTKTYFQAAFPNTHDGMNHLARFANYKIALKEGQLPPRFAPNLYNRHGYPVFNFNYPLANLISVPFSAFKINPEITFKLIAVGSLFLGLIGVYLLVTAYQFSKVSALFGTAVFASSPFLSNLYVVRGSIGEMLAVTLLPWVLLSLKQKQVLKTTLPSIFFLTLFVLSHNISVLIASPLLIIYIGLQYQKNGLYLKSVIMILLVSFLLSGWFWIPAILEKGHTVVEEGVLVDQFVSHAASFDQLLYSPLEFGFSYPGPVDTLSFQVGVIQMVSLLFCLILIIQIRLQLPHIVIFTFSSSIFFLFFQTSLAAPILSAIPFLNIIQFPWRFSILLITSLPIVAAFAFSQLRLSARFILLMLLFFQMVVVSKAKPSGYFHKESIEYDLFAQSTSTKNENRTKQFTYLDYGNWQPAPTFLGQATAQTKFWNGSRREYSVLAFSDVTVIEPTMYFPGWQTKILSKDGRQFMAEQIFTAETQGRVAYLLEPGEYSIRSQFTQHTPARIISHLLFFVGVLTISIMSVLESRRARTGDE